MLFVLFLFIALCFAEDCAPGSSYPGSAVPSGRCAQLWASGLARPRGLITASNGDLLVVESNANTVTALWDADNDGYSSPSERKVIAKYPGINHGIEISGDFLYASSPTTLVRFKYSAKDRAAGPAIVVVQNIPGDGHPTRTPKIDAQGFLFLSLGSASNIDTNTNHSQVRRFDLRNFQTAIEWSSGEIWASGLRNEVGLDFDPSGRLWGVMNGMDDLYRADLGGDIHLTNPAEPLNLLSEPGKFYGYPYCWTEYLLPRYGKGKGTQWAHENSMHDGVHTDAWCQNKANVIPPAWPLSPHTAPLGLFFWRSNSFGTDFNGDALVSLHGSWDTQPPSGYRVQRVKFQNGAPISESPFLYYKGPGENWPNNFRPVGLASNLCLLNVSSVDCLYVASDASGEIVRVK